MLEMENKDEKSHYTTYNKTLTTVQFDTPGPSLDSPVLNVR